MLNEQPVTHPEPLLNRLEPMDQAGFREMLLNVRVTRLHELLPAAWKQARENR